MGIKTNYYGKFKVEIVTEQFDTFSFQDMKGGDVIWLKNTS